jgi:hypothetical protein
MEVAMAEQTNVTSRVKVASIKHETPKAWLAIMEDSKEIWFPKSQCKLSDDLMTVPNWLLKEKGVTADWDD